MKTSRLVRAAALALGFALIGGAGVFAGTLTVRPGVPNVGGAARYFGNQGLEVNVASPDRTAAYVQSSHPSAETAYRVRFYVNVRGLAMGNADEFDLFDAYDGADPTPPTTTGNIVFRVVVRGSGGQKVLSAFVRTDAGTETEVPTPVTLVNGWRMVEVDWLKATSAGANNGHLTLWVDGVQKDSLASLGNANSTINYARLGSVGGVDAATSGTMDLDEFVSQRSGYIGPLQVFGDVAPGAQFYNYIQGLYASELTTGCGSGLYCPNDTVTRDQMAVFLVRGIHGVSFVPPAATGIFGDVSTSYWAAPYIEQLYHDGITSGCSSSPLLYCPTDPVNRDQMSVFLMRLKHGSSYTPPAATGIFGDVPASFYQPFIEELYHEAITLGCSSSPLLYCPSDPVTRGQMAAFLGRTLSLPTQEVGP
jgi:hypothetical protein